MDFCDNCENIITATYTSSTFIFVCKKCNRKIKPKPEDTLREYIDLKKKDSEEYSTIIKNTPFDKTNPRKYGKCSKCDNKVLSYVILGNSAKYTSVCICGQIN